jgi:hypothetical protein
MKPKRIQRKRTKGWKIPDNTVSITRPGKWGNPFKVVGNMVYGDTSHRRGKILSPWIFIDNYADEKEATQQAVLLFEAWICGEELNHGLYPKQIKLCPYSVEDIKRELKGKNLACFCSEKSKDCHGDVLLEIANQK